MEFKNRAELAGYLSTLGIDEHPENFFPMADYILELISETKRKAIIETAKKFNRIARYWTCLNCKSDGIDISKCEYEEGTTPCHLRLCTMTENRIIDDEK